MGFILEELNQDQKSFHSYASNSKSLPIKRGDFLLRNRGNIEVDVKCRSFYNFKGKTYFDFKCEDVVKHKNMISFTNTPILIAVYQSKEDIPMENDVYMFDIQRLLESKEIEKYFRPGIGDCYRIPVSFTSKGFDLIDQTYRLETEIKSSKIKKTLSIGDKKSSDPNA